MTGRHIAIASILLLGAAPALGQPGQTGADRASAFQRADQNGDGRVTRAEYSAAHAREFKKADRNADGVLTRSDFPRLAGSQRYGARFDTVFGMADTNKDGKVTRAEFQGNEEKTFNLADANHDGAIDRAEIDRIRAARQKP